MPAHRYLLRLLPALFSSLLFLPAAESESAAGSVRRLPRPGMGSTSIPESMSADLHPHSGHRTVPLRWISYPSGLPHRSRLHCRSGVDRILRSLIDGYRNGLVLHCAGCQFTLLFYLIDQIIPVYDIAVIAVITADRIGHILRNVAVVLRTDHTAAVPPTPEASVSVFSWEMMPLLSLRSIFSGVV